MRGRRSKSSHGRRTCNGPRRSRSNTAESNAVHKSPATGFLFFSHASFPLSLCPLPRRGEGVAPAHPALATFAHPCAAKLDRLRVELSSAEGDATFRQIVGRQLYRYAVAGEYANVVLAHLAGNVGGHDVAVIQLDAKQRVVWRFGNRSLHFNVFFFGHEAISNPGSVGRRMMPYSPSMVKFFDGGPAVVTSRK